MDFPPPIGITDIFNPSQFPQTFSLLEQLINAGSGLFLQYPVAQGSQTWEEAGFTFVMGAEGLTYNGTTTTWANLQIKIEAIQALSQASNSLTLNVDNRIRIQNGETINNPTSYIDISSGLTNEIVSTTNLTIQAPNINMNGITTFNTTPINNASPILGNELANKGYVDSLAGQFGGSYNLFFNYTNVVPITPPPVWRELSPVVDDNAGVILVTNPVATGIQEIARFITAPINITEIPIGIWEAYVYGAVSATANDVHYSFELWKRETDLTDTLLATSGISPDVNASPNNNPSSYAMSATISSVIPLDPTDRLFIVLYVTKTGVNVISLSTYFEGNYYSYIQTSLNAGTTLLSSTNTWSASNNFLLPITTPTNATPTNNQIINYGDITTLINAIEPIVSTSNIFLSTINSAFQYPPAEPPSAIINTYQYYGWYFINAVAGRKIDWYYPPSKNMIVSDILGLYINFFNITTTNPQALPFISVYTKPTGVNDAIPFFAHSVMTYSLYDGLPINPFLPVANTAYCGFMNKSGTQPNPFAYGHTIQNMLISPVPNNPRGSYLPTEEVAYISVGSNSTSSVNQVNFVLSKVGICLANGNQENILNPQNILSPSSTWVGTATSNLNMSSFGITATSSLNLGEPLKSVVINGAVQVPNALNYGSGANLVVAYGGEANNIYDTTTTNNIQTRIINSGGIIEQEYNAIISPSASGSGALILPLVKTRHSVNIINGSAYNWTIASQTGELIIGGLAGSGITSSSSITIKPAQILGFVQVDGGLLGKFNIFISEVIQGTSPTFSGATCPTIDTAGALTLGTTNALGTTLGRASQTTNIQGNLQIAGSAGSNAQVLTSNGTTASWQTPSAGSSSLAVVKTNPTLLTQAYGAGAFRAVYSNNFLNITPPSLTATYLIQCQLLCNNNVANTAFFGNLGFQVGGGAQTTSAISLFNNLAMSNVANTTFNQVNSLSQCNLSVDNTYNQLSFTYIHTPATLSLVSYAFWLGSSVGNGAGTIFSMSVIRIIA